MQDESMKQDLIMLETKRSALLRTQCVDNNRSRNVNREALTALKRKAHTTRSSVPSPGYWGFRSEAPGAGERPDDASVLSSRRDAANLNVVGVCLMD
ncbi:hypothetical protein MLD38_038513 [Melastoma candidum]|uniref:Uncharacterized protein n=1 Tax=Melastoma candidum TaxID=119954 RepID=A0ACB9L008_9MYRT|nr:hypothetical protein MLD38_038513 [Melastoma candidum]